MARLGCANCAHRLVVDSVMLKKEVEAKSAPGQEQRMQDHTYHLLDALIDKRQCWDTDATCDLPGRFLTLLQDALAGLSAFAKEQEVSVLSAVT